MVCWIMANDRFMAVSIPSSSSSSFCRVEKCKCRMNGRLCRAPTNHLLKAELDRAVTRAISSMATQAHTRSCAYRDRNSLAFASLLCHTFAIKMPSFARCYRFRDGISGAEDLQENRNKHFYEYKYLFKWHEIKSFMAAALRLSFDSIFN